MQIAALEDLLSIVEKEIGINGACSNEPDNSSVGWDGYGNPLPMTFGHVRRARAELEKISSEANL